jgi:hypothetical protein
MTEDEVRPGVLVNIPAPRNENDTEAYARAVYYLDALLINWHYPYDYLVIGEPYTSDDNVRLYMAPGFPQFCVESFNLADVTLCGGSGTTKGERD